MSEEENNEKNNGSGEENENKQSKQEVEENKPIQRICHKRFITNIKHKKLKEKYYKLNSDFNGISFIVY